MSCSPSRHPLAYPLLALALYACGPEPNFDAARLEAGVREGRKVVMVIPAAGVRINARVPPALELENGAVIRLAAGRVMADSSYFAEPPWGAWPVGVRLQGVLRVGFCRVTEALCRTVSIPIALPE